MRTRLVCRRLGRRPTLATPITRGSGPDGADDRTPDDEVGKEKHFLPLMAGVLFVRTWKADHIASKVPKGLGSVAITPGYNVGITLGYCSFNAIRTTSKPISVPGAKARSVPVAADTTA